MEHFRGLTWSTAPGAGASLAGVGVSLALHGALAVVVMYGGMVRSADPDADSPWGEVIFLAPYASTPSPLRVERVSYVSLEAVGEGEGGATESEGTPVENPDIYSREALVPLEDSLESESLAGATPSDEEVYMESQVEDPVAYDALSAAPRYPDSLRVQNIEGVAVVEFVVNAMGRADTLTFRILQTTHADFAVAVREALPRMRFSPARVNGLAVQQFVQIPFVFKIVLQGDSLLDPPAPIGGTGGAARDSTSSGGQ